MIGSDSVVWSHVADKAAEEDIEIDLNSFQHYIYLETEIEQFNYDLTVLGETSLAPLGIYSKLLDDVSEVQDGDQIVIPDDVTNGGRALLLLQAVGLITVDEAAGLTPTIKDIDNPRNFDIVELAAANIPASLEEAPLAIINSGIATDADLIPSEDALVLEDSNPGDNPYINVIVSRTEDVEDETFNRIVELYQTEDTKEVIIEDSKGSSIPVF